jgi:hypothetical protein
VLTITITAIKFFSDLLLQKFPLLLNQTTHDYYLALLYILDCTKDFL